MAAPQRRYRVPTPLGPVARPLEKQRPGRAPGEVARRSAAERRAAARRRRFAVLVVVPVLLMLGSVYIHTISDALGGRVAYLEQRLARAEAEGEKLDVRVAELSGPGRIQSLAADELQMRVPGGADMKVYVRHGEDGKPNGEEAKGGQPR
jgi:cell division protein FtsL